MNFTGSDPAVFEEIEISAFRYLYREGEMIIRPDPAKFCSTHEIDFSSRTHEPLLSLPPSLQPTFRFTFFGQGRSIGGVWQSRINGDLIKDYSWTKIKINLTPAAEETNKRGSRRGCDVEAVCSSTSRPMALIIRWRQMEREGERERDDRGEGERIPIRRAGWKRSFF